MTQMHKANKFVFCDVKAPAFSVSVFWHHLCYIAYQLLYSRVSPFVVVVLHYQEESGDLGIAPTIKRLVMALRLGRR
jgi:hypothetical protein